MATTPTGAPPQLHPDDFEVTAEAPRDQIPAFEQQAVGNIHQQVDRDSGDGTAAHVNPGSSTVHVTDPSQYNGGTPQHEYTHVYEGKKQPILKTLFAGGNGADQDYGGTPGLEKHNAQGKTIAQFNPEQRAEVVGDSWAAQKKAVADAKAGKLKPGEVEGFDRAKAAQHPTLQQMKNEGDEGIDTHPAAPGLPPASVSGIVAPDPLLGGEWAQAKEPEKFDPAKHFVKPGTGAKLSEEDAQKYLVKAKGNKAVAREMAKHDNHTF
jgi:hypothetical protein